MQTQTNLKRTKKAEDDSIGEIAPVRVNLFLTYDGHSEIDRFISKLKGKFIKTFKKRGRVSFSTICQALVEIKLSDKELQKRVEERLLEKLNAKTK